MKMLTLKQVADYLKSVNIRETIDLKHALVHIGENAAGVSFVLVNDMYGESSLTEGIESL